MSERREYMGGMPVDPNKFEHFVPDVDLAQLARETARAVEQVRASRDHGFYDKGQNPVRRDSMRLGMGTMNK